MEETQTQEQATLGEQAMLSKEPVLTIGGREYRLRKLGLEAMEPLALIVEAALTAGVIADVSELMDDSKRTRLLIFAVAHCKGPLFEIASQLLGVSEDDLRDPEQFGLGDLVAVIGAVQQSRDVSAFLPTGPAPEGPADPSASGESSI